MCEIVTIFSLYGSFKIDRKIRRLLRYSINEPHGYGIIVIYGDNTVEVWKTMDKEKMKKKIRQLENKKLRFLLVHGRLATSGKINLVNCHPFILRNCITCHNGFIHDLNLNSVYCDTYLFSLIIDNLIEREEDIGSILELIEKNNIGLFVLFLPKKRKFYFLQSSFAWYRLAKRDNIVIISKYIHGLCFRKIEVTIEDKKICYRNIDSVLSPFLYNIKSVNDEERIIFDLR